MATEGTLVHRSPNTSLLVKTLCYLSVVSACVLLLSPTAVFSVVRACTLNVYYAVIGDGNASASEQAPASKHKDSGVDDPISQVNSVVAEGNRLTSLSDPITGNPIDHPPRSVFDGYPLEAYKTATAEIRERINQEHILFTLKFTIIGGILLALFSMSKSEHFEAFIQRRRTAVFFSAALLTSSVVDIRLRFDIQMVETIGKWVRHIETRLHDPQILGYQPWESFLHREMFGLGMPVMRSFSLSLTALLYLVTVYTFVILPRGAYEGTRRIIRGCIVVMFALLAFVGGTYERNVWPISVGIAAVGVLFLFAALQLKKRRDGVLNVVAPIVARLEQTAFDRRLAGAPQNVGQPPESEAPPAAPTPGESPPTLTELSDAISAIAETRRRQRLEEKERQRVTCAARVTTLEQTMADAKESGRLEQQTRELAEAKASLEAATRDYEREVADLTPDAAAEEVVKRARIYVEWVDRVRNPRQYLKKVLQGIPDTTEESLTTLYERLQAASVPERNALAFCYTLHESARRFEGALTGWVDSYSNWVTFLINRGRWRRLERLISEDADEAEAAEDFLWNVYFDIQAALRAGGLRRSPLVIDIPSEVPAPRASLRSGKFFAVPDEATK